MSSYILGLHKKEKNILLTNIGLLTENLARTETKLELAEQEINLLKRKTTRLEEELKQKQEAMNNLFLANETFRLDKVEQDQEIAQLKQELQTYRRRRFRPRPSTSNRTSTSRAD